MRALAAKEEGGCSTGREETWSSTCSANLQMPPPKPRKVLRVQVQGINGCQVAEVDVSSVDTVALLKQRIQDLCQIPRKVQKLMIGNTMLTDLQTLDSYQQEQNETLIVTLCQSLDVVLENLQSTSERRRKKGLHTLRRLGLKGGAAGCHALGIALESDSIEMRCAALKMLHKVAEKGDQFAINTVRTCLHDTHWKVRYVAVKQAGRVLQRGDNFAINLVCDLLEDPVTHVRAAAVKSLKDVLCPSSLGCAIDAICSRLNHERHHVRHAAVEAISAVVCKGNMVAINKIIDCLKCTRPEVRKCTASAEQALIKLAEPGDELFVAAVSGLLEHGRDDVRQSAARVLGEFAGKGNRCVIDAVVARLENPCPGVRGAAISVLGRMVEQDDERAIESVCACLGHEEQWVRSSALDALASAERAVVPRAVRLVFSGLKSSGNGPKDFCFSVVRELLGHANPELRQAVVEAVGKEFSNYRKRSQDSSSPCAAPLKKARQTREPPQEVAGHESW